MTDVNFALPLLRDGYVPAAELDALRTEQPIARLELPEGIDVTGWLITRYDDAKAVLGDHQRFSNDFTRLAEAGDLQSLLQQDPGGLGLIDPPDHTRLRKIVTPEFTMRRLRRLEPLIDGIIAERLDAIAAAGPGADLVELYALPIPSLVITELLGVPYEDRDEFVDHSADRFTFTGDIGDSLGQIGESLKYLRGLVEKMRANPDGDGLIPQIIREHGDDITDTELAGLADGILTGGHETTASMIALGAHVLMQNPDYVSLISNAEPKQAQEIVDELLRVLTVVQVGFPRLAKEDVEVGGQLIKAGELALVSLSAANRDDALTPDAQTLDLRRGTTSHLAFGYGIHRCIGAELGRMELKVALPELFRRFPGIKHEGDPDLVDYRMFSIVFGLESLPVTW
ncbi:cytochrome P450 [Epidermidibacterium keratini]|uniref:Cytochrome P450 n=1 Tax=Epidermidibacterium keratini TaxID=1891644 RepID=A0A7L4YM38_9ACTN|nr:cytochrome P450 [Epidermidibacterium keratini]QHB99888.1 cytochrome P450 [Epidermidibacterium keratini]